MPDLQPYGAAKHCIHAHVRGQQYDVIVLDRRGDRVHLTWAPTWASTSIRCRRPTWSGAEGLCFG